MKKYAFVTRHAPTPEQIQLATSADIELVPVGDRDAFSFEPSEFAHFAGVVVVHPAAALACFAAGQWVGVFENANRAPEGQKPQFLAIRLWIYMSHGGAFSYGHMEFPVRS